MTVSTNIQLTTREVSAAHGISLRTAQRWAAQGKLNATKDTSGRWVITLTTSLDDYKPAAVTKATELIEQGGILPTRRPGIYTVVASNGTTTYLAHRSACSCPAGLRGRHVCYHRAAVAIVQAAAPARRAA